MKKQKKKQATATSPVENQQREMQPPKNDEVALADDGIRGAYSTDASPPGYGGGMGLMPSYGMGMGLGGMGMYGMGGMGMYGMGAMYGGGGMGGAMMGPLISLNQFLFGIQSVVFSLGQAVQIVGMNAQQIRHVYEGVRGMVESALGQVNDKLGLASVASFDEVIGGAKGGGAVGGAMRWLTVSGGEEEHGHDDDDSRRGGDRTKFVPTHADIVRRRRLAAFRWTITLSASYFLYRTVRRLLRVLFQGPDAGRGSENEYLHQLQSGNGYYGDGGVSHNQYYGNNGMMGGGYGYGSNRYNVSGYGQRGYGHDQYSRGYGDMNGGYY